MKILLTGATGFVGGYLLRKLTACGHSVRAMVRSDADAEKAAKAGAEPFRSDLLDGGTSLSECVRGMEAVVHCGGLPSEAEEELFFRSNTLGSFLLLERSRSAGVKQFIFISSILVYGLEKPLYIPVDEKHPLFPREQAGVYKAAVEEYCRYYHLRYGMNTSVFRLAAVFGEIRKKHHTWPEIIEALRAQRAGGELRLPRGAGIMVVSANDVADVVSLSLGKENTGGETYNLVDFYLETVEGARRIAELGNLKCKISDFGAGIKPFIISNEKLRSAIKFEFSGRRYLDEYFMYLLRAHACK